MQYITVCKEGVLKLLKNLKLHKAPGPDDINPALREVADIICEPITTLFQMSLDKATLPTDWKTAKVCPIFKKGDKYAVANYRPVSLTSIIGKQLENIITSRLMSHAEEQKLLYDHQHGFRQNKGCEKQLLELVSDISSMMDNGDEVHACILDFSKAFDKVNHIKLVQKLATIRVSSQLSSWIAKILARG